MTFSNRVWWWRWSGRVKVAYKEHGKFKDFTINIKGKVWIEIKDFAKLFSTKLTMSNIIVWRQSLAPWSYFIDMFATLEKKKKGASRQKKISYYKKKYVGVA